MNFVGVDGCKEGWFTVDLTIDDEWEINVFKDIFTLWNTFQKKYDNKFLIFIDIPIGLKEKGSTGRLCDKQARKAIGKRRSSVFPPPCRQATYEDSYENASHVNKKITGKSLTKQTFAISSKIREVDMLMEINDVKQYILEVHPELCFYGLSGSPMEFNKKKNEGFLERRDILMTYCKATDDIIDSALSTYKRKEVARDDILDALSAAVTAKLCHQNGFTSIPEHPESDGKGLPMQMIYFRNKT